MIPERERFRRPGVGPLRGLGLVAALTACLVMVGCRQDMHDQPKYEPFESSDFFLDGQAARLPVAGTVARGSLREDPAYFAGLTAEGTPVPTLPIELDRATLERGRELYDVYCSPCHDRAGTGNGIIVQRGFKRPESFHAARLRQSPPGYFFQVATNGFGEMSSYAGQVEVAERWAIVAYIRALQLSRAIPVDELSDRDRRELERVAAAEAASGMEAAAAQAETDQQEEGD